MSTKQKNSVGSNPPPSGPAPTPPQAPPTTNDNALVNELRERLAETELKLEDALARLGDALKQADEFVPHSEDPLLNLTEAGELVGRSHQTIRNLIRDRMLRSVDEPGGLTRVRRSSLTRLFAESALIDKEIQERDARTTERIRAQGDALAAKMRAEQGDIEAPPEGQRDTYINPVIEQLRRQREQAESQVAAE